MLLRKRSFVLLSNVLMGLVAFVAVRPAAGGENATPRPFQAVGVAVWDNIFAAFDPSVGASFQGTGNGTHLGYFDQAGSLIFSGPPDANGVIPGFGSVTFTAANGDELSFDYEGGLDSTTGIGTGTLTFTGGTGRFAGASGDGEFYAEIDISAGPVNAPMKVWLTGEVVY